MTTKKTSEDNLSDILELVKLFLNLNFLSTLSDFFVNLSAGWFGAILILPGIWKSYDVQTNVVIFLTNLFYGTISLYFSYYLKKLKNAN